MMVRFWPAQKEWIVESWAPYQKKSNPLPRLQRGIEMVHNANQNDSLKATMHRSGIPHRFSIG
ncbi:MAG: hypothetical protein JW908_13620 [Anaerolineales bacterium]|nr:hypothetical protein [Anaerolineales bacterium]